MRQNLIEPGVFKGGYSSDSKVKTQSDNFLSLIQCAGKAMKNTGQISQRRFGDNLHRFGMTVPHMDHHGQAFCGGPSELNFERFFLLIAKCFIPVQVDSYFTDAVKFMLIKHGFNMSEFLLIVFIH